MRRLLALLLTLAVGLLPGCGAKAGSSIPQELADFKFDELSGQQIRLEELTGSWELLWYAMDNDDLAPYDPAETGACVYEFTPENRLRVTYGGKEAYALELVAEGDMIFYFFEGQQDNAYAMRCFKEIDAQRYLVYVEFSGNGAESSTLVFRQKEDNT